MWLGVDGGGTKTAFALYDNNLTEVDRLVLPTCHYAQIGFDGMRDVLAKGVAWAEERVTRRMEEQDGGAPNRETAESLNTPSDTAPHFGIGFAICGYGEGAETTARMDDIVREVSGSHPYILVNDVEAAWAAGLACADGIAIIAGTGSIGFGSCQGEQMRCGGWDYELGDEGSGGWLGKELLRAFTRQADGRDPRGPLYNLVREELNLQDDFDIIAWAQTHYGKRGDVAPLSVLVSRAAAAGDASALAILQHAAEEEADLVRAIKRQLFDRLPASGRPTSAPIPVTYIGGTFKAGPLILEPLARSLPTGCELVAPLHDPALGPVLLLRRSMKTAS